MTKPFQGLSMAEEHDLTHKLDVIMTVLYNGTMNRQEVGAYIKRELWAAKGQHAPEDPRSAGVLVLNLKIGNRRESIMP